MKYRVTKRVIEYHVFHIEAEDEEKAFEEATCDAKYYCDTDNAEDIETEVWQVIEADKWVVE